MSAQDLNIADDSAPVSEFERRPKAGMVIGLLAGASLIISYLFAYCVINALAASDVIARWKPDHDPRPKYFAVAFVVLSAAFSGVGFVARAASKRQMRKFEDMENAPDEVTSSTQF
jgi:hypothetical protein